MVCSCATIYVGENSEYTPNKIVAVGAGYYDDRVIARRIFTRVDHHRGQV